MGYENSNNQKHCQESREQERKEEKQERPFTFGRRHCRAELSSNSYFPNSDIFTGRPSWSDRSAAKTTR